MVVSVVTSTPVSIISSTTRNAVPMSPHLPNAAKGGNKGSHNIINLHIKGRGKIKKQLDCCTTNMGEDCDGYTYRELRLLKSARNSVRKGFEGEDDGTGSNH